jgi:hypothetical protein
MGAPGSGGLPALAKLNVRAEACWGAVKEVRTRVAPAFEAVAGTLMHLNIGKYIYGIWLDDEEDVGYELGVAVGKLRRLKDLALGLFRDGRGYHAFAQGLAASGGERPLPLLWRVMLPQGVHSNADQVASLLLPSVRVFGSCYRDNEQTLLTACALRRAGYKHTWFLRLPDRLDYIEEVPAALGLCSIVHELDQSQHPPWTGMTVDRFFGHVMSE